MHMQFGGDKPLVRLGTCIGNAVEHASSSFGRTCSVLLWIVSSGLGPILAWYCGSVSQYIVS